MARMPGRQKAAPVQQRPAPRCPECGGRVAYDLTCWTYGTGDRFYSCMPCDSAIEYLCTEWLDDENPGDCDWRYTDGLNPKNPRSAANEAKRPAWLDGHELVQRGDTVALPGVRMLGSD